MPRTQPTIIPTPLLEQSLLSLTVDELKWYADALPGPTKLRKADVIAKITAVLLNPELLRQLWAQVGEKQQWVIEEVVHNGGGWCDLGRLEARYPDVSAPRSPRSRYASYSVGSYYNDQFKKSVATAYDIFFCYIYDLSFFIPSDVTALLMQIAPPPPPNTLANSEHPPVIVGHPGLPEPPEVMRANSELTIYDDLAAVLHLVQQGKASVGSATRLPTLTTVRSLKQLLSDDDYFPDMEYGRAEDAIRPLALVMLCQAAGWIEPATAGGTRLALTTVGQSLVGGPLEPRHIREVWEAWLKSDLLDELTRVKAIRGQQSKDVRLTKPSKRRELLAETLRDCTPGRWMLIDEFIRYMRAEDKLPAIERTSLQHLFVGYVSSYDGWDESMPYWDVITGTYLRAAIWEYLATLGVVEIAYTWPEETLRDFESLYSLDEDYISRYDGLLGFRLTNLGAYALGLTNGYTPPEAPVIEGPPTLVLLPNLDVVITDSVRLTRNERAFLGRIGTAESENVYHLSRELLLDFEESGASLEQVKKFLATKGGVGEEKFPQTVRVFFADIEKRLNAVRLRGRKIMLEGDEYVLTELARSRALRDIVELGRIGDRTILLMPEEQEKAVRKQMKKAGYVPRKQ